MEISATGPSSCAQDSLCPVGAAGLACHGSGLALLVDALHIVRRPADDGRPMKSQIAEPRGVILVMLAAWLVLCWPISAQQSIPDALLRVTVVTPRVWTNVRRCSRPRHGRRSLL
jgi:hypothetical protein